MPSTGWRRGECERRPARQAAVLSAQLGRCTPASRILAVSCCPFSSFFHPPSPPPPPPSRRYLPLLRPRMVPYQLHLYAERCEITEGRVAELIMQ